MRARRKFDGLVGTPPEWIPRALARDFVKARDSLLDSHTVREVRGWLVGYRKVQEPAPMARGIPRFPSERVRELAVIDEVVFLVGRGEGVAVREYMGERAHDRLGRRIVAARDKTMRSQGGRARGRKIRAANAKRDQRIRELASQPNTRLKQIAGAVGVSISTVRRVLAQR